MTLYKRYLNGETAKVYEEIERTGPDAFLPAVYSDIEKVLNETFQRTSYNLEIIYHELQQINYVFKTDYTYNSQRPLTKPLADVDELLIQLEKSVRPFGFVPESLKMFYKIVGACNFAWDYNSDENLRWNEADPIQICSLDDLVTDLNDPSAQQCLRENFEDEDFAPLQLSADFLHKDNISGGIAYAMQLTSSPAIDAKLLFEEHDTSFINYLRICFENCGFSRITLPGSGNDYQAFFNKVKPQLKPI